MARPSFQLDQYDLENARQSLRLTQEELARKCDVNVQTIRKALRGIKVVTPDAAKICEFLHRQGRRVKGPYPLDEMELIDNFLSTLQRRRGRMHSALEFGWVTNNPKRLTVTERTSYEKLNNDDIVFRFGARPTEILSIYRLDFSIEQGGYRIPVEIPRDMTRQGSLLSLVTSVRNEGSKDEEIGLTVPLPQRFERAQCLMITSAKYEVPFERLFTWQTALTAKGFDLEITIPDTLINLDIECFLIEPPENKKSRDADGRVRMSYKTDRHVPAGCGLVWRFRRSS